ncbi:MAG: M14 family metallopeptidase [Planctomycetota bacterium]|nr:M14 family metallopeptidase [Planctomycetota bacterium]
MPPKTLASIPFALLAACSTTSHTDVAAAARLAPAPVRFEEPARLAPAPEPPPERAGIAFGDSRAASSLPAFFPASTYDARVPVPDTLLRQPLGTFTAHHGEVLAALRAIDAASDRVRIAPFGRTHEGRELVQVVIASPENMARLDDIRARIAKLADPRGVDAGELDRIVRETPAIAWLAYSIHGDETSGTDASVAVAYHLAAGTSADVAAILRDVVVVIDPCQNPDGRERVLAMFEQGSGYQPDLDTASMRRGRWPYGRENHYLFDMNRDWMWGTQPETRARWKAITSWHPQLLVDAHEMGSSDTFLFYPATDPFTPYFPKFTRTWWQRYGDDQAAAFDAHGWSYYTREWADSWYPGYTDAWATFQGACGILYEQARYAGGSVLRRSGEVATYREAVQRQAVGSISNLTTLAKNREAVLRDYVAEKQRNVAADTEGNDRVFVIARGREAAREEHLVDSLMEQGVEVYLNDAAFQVTDAEGVRGVTVAREVPANSFVIPARQPLAPLVKAALAFDPRYDQASLERERKELERKGRSKAYDVTGWSPAHAYDLDALWCAAPGVKLRPFRDLDRTVRAEGIAVLPGDAGPVYGWIVDGAADASVAFAARALEAGLAVQVSDEPFRAAGRSFPSGSLLVRRVENGADVRERVERAAREAHVAVVPATSARSRDDGPDLGGQHFDLLERPRVAMLSNAPVSSDSFGHAWHALDVLYGVPVSLLDAQGFGFADLRRYNVLVVPDGGGSVLREHLEDLRTWVRAGGTLIALGGDAASALADKESGLSAVRRRSDVLDDLGPYRRAVQREREAGKTAIDLEALWEGKPLKAAEAPKEEPKELKGDEAKERDRWATTFSPQGAILRGEVNTDLWITAGCRGELPVFFDGSGVLLSQPPTRTAVRLAASERLRLSGLLWPEARERIADSAWLTVERQGAGQVILFAASPVFRGWFRGTARLFANAVVYGPGLGASPPAPR